MTAKKSIDVTVPDTPLTSDVFIFYLISSYSIHPTQVLFQFSLLPDIKLEASSSIIWTSTLTFNFFLCPYIISNLFFFTNNWCLANMLICVMFQKYSLMLTFCTLVSSLQAPCSIIGNFDKDELFDSDELW